MLGRIFSALLAVSLLAACSSSDTKTESRAGTGTGASGTETRGPWGTTGDKILFDTDRAVIRDDARPVLDAQATWLGQNKTANILITGNCDERGTQEYNIALGNRRAFSAANYLAAKGVELGRISTMSYGKDRPVAPGSTEEAWAQNRNAITSVR